MPSDYEATRRWLIDIRHNIALAESFTADVAYDAFKDDMMRLYAVIRCLEIISEAAAGSVYLHDYEDVAASFV